MTTSPSDLRSVIEWRSCEERPERGRELLLLANHDLYLASEYAAFDDDEIVFLDQGGPSMPWDEFRLWAYCDDVTKQIPDVEDVTGCDKTKERD